MTDQPLMFLVREAHRRRVFRTAAYYLVGAWVLLQVGDVVFPILGLPDEALQLVLAASIAGFPAALIVGWKYDITPRGIRRTPSVQESVDATDLSLKRTDYVLLVAIAAIAIVIAFQVPLPTFEPRRVSDAPEDSVAVMPFEICENQDIDSLMAAGIATEVINRLAERVYVPIIRWALEHRLVVVLVALGIFAGTMSLAREIQTLSVVRRRSRAASLGSPDGLGVLLVILAHL